MTKKTASHAMPGSSSQYGVAREERSPLAGLATVGRSWFWVSFR